MSISVNDKLILLGGKSASGKSASLMGLRNPEGVMYLNCEAGKKLPFRSKFQEFVITDPHQVTEGIETAEDMSNVHTIIVDSLTYLMDMYESNFVLNSNNGMKAWPEFAQFFKNMMQRSVAASTKNIVFIAHTLDALNEQEMTMETKVPIKGALKNNGVESYFSCVIGSKKLPLTALDKYKSDLLVITPEEEALGFKYVFQTKITKETVNERLRGPLGLFSTEETFTDNDLQKILDRLDEYYQ